MPPAGNTDTEPAVMQMINVSSVEGRGPQEIEPMNLREKLLV